MASGTLPVALTAVLALLFAGAAAAQGGPFLGELVGILVEIGHDWLRLVALLWLAAFFMVVMGYGMGRHLIGLTLRQPLSSPLASMAHHLRGLARCLSRFFALSSSCLRDTPNGPTRPGSPYRSIGLAPPAALLAGTAPLLE